MKNNKNFFEKNISRLVKLARKSEKPSKSFEESLINDAVDELQQKGAYRSKFRSDNVVKVRKILLYAAAVILICGGMAALILPGFKTVGEMALQKCPEPTGTPEMIGMAGKNKEYKREYSDDIKREVAKPKANMTAKELTAPAASSTLSAEKIEAKSAVAKNINELTQLNTAKLEGENLRRREIKGSSDISRANLKSGKPVTGNSYDTLKAQQALGAKTSEKLAYNYSITAPSDNFSIKTPSAGGNESALELLREAQPSVKYRRRICIPVKPWERPGGYPMAHGGTTPPNGEDVDAMFFQNYGVNPFVDTEDDHLSTFATDVDTGSYTIARKYLHEGHLPPQDAVRVEEFVNYFDYRYAAPQEDDFAVYAEAAPWNFGSPRKNSYLIRFALQGREIAETDRKPAILTFVIDVSGSMNRENRLGLVKQSLRMLVNKLKPEDKIGIAAYNMRGRKVMDYKSLDEKYDILAAIDSLRANGSTYAEEGINIGYEMAEKAFLPNYINRIILCSDGVANVGKTDAEAILQMIKEKADKGIMLSAIGFGMSNYNDVLLEKLGDKGNGHYAYVDTIAEAKRIFETQLTGTLQVIARDAKIQVDFNPDVVRSYRLIGYENRDVPDDKFRDDKVDGGQIGAGHSTTALYEIKLWPEKQGTLAAISLRYKDAKAKTVTEVKNSVNTTDIKENFDAATTDFKLAATAAEFAEILRGSYWAKGAKLSDTLENAQSLIEEKPGDTDIIELLDLIAKANNLMKNK